MSYENLKRSAAFVCEHVALRRRPILRAKHDVPIDPADSGWQFLCGVENHTDSAPLLWALEEVAQLDFSLRTILDSPQETCFERSTVDTPWRSVPYDS